MKNNNVCVVILAGGLSLRMGGGIKSLKKFNKRNIIERILERIKPQANYILINSNEEKIFNKYNFPVIKDKIAGYLGPLAGIHASLNWIKKNIPHVEWLVTIPGDTPFLPKNLISKLFNKAKNHNIILITCKFT